MEVNNNYCKKKIDTIQKNIFTIHGLWPDFMPPGSSLNESCNKARNVALEELNPSDNPMLFGFLNSYWISNRFENKGFWSHEYNKHGFCYTLKNQNQPIDYFNLVMNKFKEKRLDKLLKDEVEKSDLIEGENDFGGVVR